MIKVLITGDFCPINRIERLIISGDFKSVFNDFISVMDGNDFNITNLECPLINNKSPILKTGPNLIAKEECIEALKFGKINLLTLSNNHILDHGEQGLLSTIQLCKNNNIEYVGAGRNLEEASHVLFRTIKNKKLAFLNFSENEFSTAEINHAGSNPLNPIRNYYCIKAAREKADYVIVIVHGGHEGYPLPSPRMVDTYRFFIDAGADIVVGHHTHCFSGHEKYNGGLIFYSLGNFIFDWENIKNSDWNYGYSVLFLIDEMKISFKIIPYKQCNEKPGVFLLKEIEYHDFENKLSKLNMTINEDTELTKEWTGFSKRMKDYCLINFECLNNKIYKSLRSRKLIPSYLSKKKKMQLLNLVNCEALRDLSIESLKPQKD